MNNPERSAPGEHLQVHLFAAAVENWRGDYDKLRIETRRGEINCRLYRATDAQAAVIMLGGGNGDAESTRELFSRLANAFPQACISAMCLSFRNVKSIEESIHDVRAAIQFLQADEAVNRVGLIGYSFGGAVALATAALEANVDAVVTLGGQSARIADVGKFRTPVLLIHGKQDRVVPAGTSRSMYEKAQGPKELLLVDSEHDLGASRQQVMDRSFDWMLSYLKTPRRS